jgi:PDZ domain-containing secreted protein
MTVVVSTTMPVGATSPLPAEPSKLDALRQHPATGRCREHELQRLSGVFDIVSVAAGEVLLRRGLVPEWLFLVVDGCVNYRSLDGIHGSEGPGSVLHLREFLECRPASSTAVAATTVTLLVARRQEAFAALDTVPELREAFGLQPTPRRTRRHRSTRRPVRRIASKIAVAAAAGALATTAALYLYQPPVLLAVPATPVDVTDDVTIEGVSVTPLTGRYLVVPIRYRRASLLQALRARPEDKVPLATRSGPAAVTAARQRAAQLHRDSQATAAVAAARLVGFETGFSGDGAVVAPHAPVGFVRDDVILRIGGEEVRDALTAARRLAGLADAKEVEVSRGGTHLRLQVQAPVRGLTLRTLEPRWELPFRVTIRDRGLTGSSAGLAYALVVADLLSSEDFARGRTVAATGAVDPSGTVLPVRHVVQKKTVAAAGAAGVFFVPAEQALPGASAVTSLADAATALASS